MGALGFHRHIKRMGNVPTLKNPRKTVWPQLLLIEIIYIKNDVLETHFLSQGRI